MNIPRLLFLWAKNAENISSNFIGGKSKLSPSVQKGGLKAFGGRATLRASSALPDPKKMGKLYQEASAITSTKDRVTPSVANLNKPISDIGLNFEKKNNV